MTCFQCKQTLPDDSQFCPFCGAKQQVKQQEKENTNTKSKSSNMRGFSNFILVVAVVLLVSTFTLALQVSKLSEEKDRMEDVYLEQKQEIVERLLERDKIAKDYESLNQRLESKTNATFCADRYVFVMTPGEKTSFTIRTIFPKGFTVSTKHQGNSAKADFSVDQWEKETVLVITAEREGITSVRFTNNVDDKEFTIYIIVV